MEKVAGFWQEQNGVLTYPANLVCQAARRSFACWGNRNPQLAIVMETLLIIGGAIFAVAMMAGAYFLVIAKQDADERNAERDLPSHDSD